MRKKCDSCGGGAPLADKFASLLRGEFFEGKIIYPCIMADGARFAYDERGFFAPAPANIISGKSETMKYLVGILNSKFAYTALRKFYMGGGIDGEFKTNNLLRLPVPPFERDEAKSRELVRLVEANLSSPSEVLVLQIEAKVCELYGVEV